MVFVPREWEGVECVVDGVSSWVLWDIVMLLLLAVGLIKMDGALRSMVGCMDRFRVVCMLGVCRARTEI